MIGNVIDVGKYSGIFSQDRQWKANLPQWILIFPFFLNKLFEFNFNSRCEISWHRGNWTGFEKLPMLQVEVSSFTFL